MLFLDILIYNKVYLYLKELEGATVSRGELETDECYDC